mmetsp:Transcript_37335/g.81156  ORF Transcript_37335/g.81156 Transcript_37335/m.81156 type:complete len:204 (-) Transcript_37335:9-620(-)
MVGCVGIRLELPGQEPTVLLSKFFSLLGHSCGTERSRSDQHLGTKHPHDLPALHGEGGCHADDQLVTSLGAHHGQADACVSAGCLDDSATRLQSATRLCLFDDTDRQAVLYRGERVEILELHVDRDPFRCHPVQLDDWCLADRLCDVTVDVAPVSHPLQLPHVVPGVGSGCADPHLLVEIRELVEIAMAPTLEAGIPTSLPSP